MEMLKNAGGARNEGGKWEALETQLSPGGCVKWQAGWRSSCQTEGTVCAFPAENSSSGWALRALGQQPQISLERETKAKPWRCPNGVAGLHLPGSRKLPCCILHSKKIRSAGGTHYLDWNNMYLEHRWLDGWWCNDRWWCNNPYCQIFYSFGFLRGPPPSSQINHTQRLILSY